MGKTMKVTRLCHIPSGTVMQLANGTKLPGSTPISKNYSDQHASFAVMGTKFLCASVFGWVGKNKTELETNHVAAVKTWVELRKGQGEANKVKVEVGIAAAVKRRRRIAPSVGPHIPS